MITYDLAKQLKDAGFPQTFPDGRWYFNNEKELVYACEDHGDVHEEQTHGIVPTVDELIEELWKFGKISGFLLNKYTTNGDWSCAAEVVNSELLGLDPKIGATGSTPKIAVAKLWLALNNEE